MTFTCAHTPRQIRRVLLNIKYHRFLMLTRYEILLNQFGPQKGQQKIYYQKKADDQKDRIHVYKMMLTYKCVHM